MAFRGSASKMTEHRDDPIGQKRDRRAYSYKMNRHDRKTYTQSPIGNTVKSIETDLITKHGCHFRLSAFHSLGASQTRRNAEQYVRSHADYEHAISKWRNAQQCAYVSPDDHRLLQRRTPAHMTSVKHRNGDPQSRGSLFPAPDKSVPFQPRVRRSVVFRNDAPDVVDVVSREPTIHFGERVVRSDVTRRSRVYPLPSVARRPRPKSILKTGHWPNDGHTGVDESRHEMTCTVRYNSGGRRSYTPCSAGQDANTNRHSPGSVCSIGSDRDEKSERNHG